MTPCWINPGRGEDERRHDGPIPPAPVSMAVLAEARAGLFQRLADRQRQSLAWLAVARDDGRLEGDSDIRSAQPGADLMSESPSNLLMRDGFSFSGESPGDSTSKHPALVRGQGNLRFYRDQGLAWWRLARPGRG